MFRLFRRRKDKPSVMYGVFQQMGSVIERKQRKAADYLNGKAATLSRRQLLIGFAVFALLFGGSAGCIIWQAFHRPASTVKVRPITVPGHSLLPEASEEPESVLTNEERDRIRSFRLYLDSLQQTPKGKKVYDSLARRRPGLLDSLALIEQVYREQLKTK